MYQSCFSQTTPLGEIDLPSLTECKAATASMQAVTLQTHSVCYNRTILESLEDLTAAYAPSGMLLSTLCAFLSASYTQVGSSYASYNQAWLAEVLAANMLMARKLLHDSC